MVSKNNKYEQQILNAKRVPHYGLRKLGIGVTSVLLSTGLYFGLNGTAANADEISSATGTGSAVNSGQTTSGGTVATGQSSVALATQPSSNAANTANSSASTSNATSAVNSASTSNAASSNTQAGNWSALYKINTQNLNSSSSASTASVAASGSNNSASTAANTTTFNVPTDSSALSPAMLGESKAKQTSSSTTLSDGSTLSLANSQLSESSTNNILTFTSSSFKAGDTYTIKIPKAYVSYVNVSSLDPSFGTVTQKEANGYIILTDKFIKSGTVNQHIGLEANTYDQFAANKNADTVYPGESFDFNISLDKNGSDEKQLKATYQVPSKLSGELVFNLARNYDHQADSVLNSIPIYNKQDLKYRVTLDSYSLGTRSTTNIASFNHGLTIKLQAPQYFSVDTSKGVSTDKGVDSKASISQSGTTITINIPAGDTNVNADSFGESKLYFYGTFNAPDSYLLGNNTRVTFTNGSLTQHFNNGTTQSLTAKDFSLILDPEVKNVSDGHIFGIYQAPSYNYVGGGYLDDQVKGLVDGKSADDTGLFYVTNITNTPQTNVHLHVEYPSGLSVKGEYFAIAVMGNKSGKNGYKVTYTYDDGSTKTYNASDNVKDTQNVRSLDLVVDELDPGAVVRIDPNGYEIDDNVQEGDNLRSTITVNNSNKITQVDEIVQTKQSPLGIETFFKVEQDSTDPTYSSKAGTVLQLNIFSPQNTSLQLTNPVVYVKLPNNAAFDNTGITFAESHTDSSHEKAITPKSQSFFKVGQDTFWKIDFSNYAKINGVLKIKNIQSGAFYNDYDAQSGESPIQLFVTSGNASQINSEALKDGGYKDTKLASTLTDTEGKAYAQEIAQHEGLSLTQLFANTNPDKWQILTSSATTSGEGAQGNQQYAPVLSGSSDEHKGSTMTYMTSVINSTKTALNNISSFTNLPNTADGKSGFNVTLTGPASIINPATGAAISGATIKYSTQPVTISSSQKPSENGFVDGSQVSDWSKIRSILVKIPTLPKETTARLVLPSQDKNIYDHVGKTAYLASSTWADGHNGGSDAQQPFIISAGSSASSNIKIVGQDTVKVAVQWKDKQGTSHYVELPDKAKTYDETLQPTMKKTDFLTSDSSLTAADKALLNLPAGYKIDYANPTVKNSSDKYENGYANGTAAFGKPVKYDFDNDTVVYTASGDVQTPTKRTKKITETIHYVYQDGKQAQPDHTQTITLTQTGVHHSETNTDDWNGTWQPANFDAVKSPAIKDYAPDQAEIAAQTVKVTNDNYSNNLDIVKTVTYKPTTKATSRTKKITETIHYVYQNGKQAQPDHTQTITLTQTGIHHIDTNTDDWNGTWQSANFGEVATPTIQGYTPDQKSIPAQTVQVTNANYPNNLDIVKTVTYKGDTQTITVKYIDDTTGKELSTKTLTGPSDSDSHYTTAATIKSYEGQHYVLVPNSDTTKGQDLIFDHDDNVNQNYEVHFTHDIKPATDAQKQHKTTKRTINYIFKDGTTHKEVTTPVVQTVDFTGSGNIDQVTGKYVSKNAQGKLVESDTATDWAADNNDEYPEKISPVVPGYIVKSVESTTPNQQDGSNVAAVTGIKHTDSDIVVNVRYVSQQKATLEYYDDTSNTYITMPSLYTPVVTGETGDTINFGGKDKDGINSLTKYVFVDATAGADPKSGVKLSGNPQTAINYGNFDNTLDVNNISQVFVLHFVHKILPATQAQQKHTTRTRVINYLFTDGTTHEEVTTPVTQTINFTGTGNIDQVTGQWVTPVTWTADNGQDTFTAVVSPKVKGYKVNTVLADTPGQIDGQNVAEMAGVKPGDKINVLVVYGPEAQDQKAVVNYIDIDNNDVQLATSGPLTGKAGTQINYSTADRIKKLVDEGYVLVNNAFDPEGQAQYYDNDDQHTQVFLVKFKHGTQTITPDNPGTPGQPINPNDPTGPKYPAGTDKNSLQVIGTQTVHYAGAGDQTPKDNVTHVEFDHSIVIDKVTGKVIQDNGWIPDTRTYQTIQTPQIKGYTPDKPYAGGETVDRTNPNREYTITYTKDQVPTVKDQIAEVRYLDQDEDNRIITTSGELTGKPNTVINYSTAKTLQQLEDEGYILVNNGFDHEGQVQYFDNNDDVPQIFIVTLKHATQTITPENPGTPGQPINPNDPTGPKYPAGTDKNSLTTVGTQTVHYVGVGDKTPKDNVSHVTFEHSIVIDKVTGSTIRDNGWTPAGQTYNVIQTPTIDGYTADQPAAGGETVTQSNPNRTYTVTYTKKPVADDTEVAEVRYLDQDNNYQEIANSGKLTGKSGTAIDYDTGATLKKLEDQGYELVRNGFDYQGQVQYYDDNPNVPQVFLVILKHGLQPVSPQNPGTPGQPINPNDPTGPKYPAGTDKNSLTKEGTQTIHYTGAGALTPKDNVTHIEFDHHLVVDKVTGKVVQDGGWTPTSQTYSVIDTPQIDGYTPDKPYAGGETVVVTNPDRTYTVNYTPVQASQPSGQTSNPSQPSGQTSSQSQPSGQTSSQSQPSGQASNPSQPSGQTSNPSQPSGQTSSQSQPSGQTSSQSQPSGQTTNPSQPSGQTSNPSQPSGQTSSQSQPSGQTSNPGQPSGQTSSQSQPSGQTSNPSQPSGQTSSQSQPSGQTSNPGQPSGQTSSQSQPSGQTSNPSQPSGQTSSQSQPSGQTSSQSQPSGQTSSPGQPSGQTSSQSQPSGQTSNPSQSSGSSQPNTTVQQHATITYVDQNTGKVIHQDNVSGDSGTVINYDTTSELQKLINEGYEVVNNGFKPGTKFDNDSSTDQHFTITLKHGETTVGPNDSHTPGTPINPNDPNGPKWPSEDNYDKSYTSTIHFVDQNGNKLISDNVQTSHWTRTLRIDKVTGQIIGETSWTSDVKQYKDVNVPVINGYYADQAKVAGPTAVQSNLEHTVTYHRLGHIIPVDQTGKPIAGAAQPIYQNDPNDPTKVVENELVPSVTGYTPTQKTVTPTNLGQDTDVTYVKENSGQSANNGNNKPANGNSVTNNGQPNNAMANNTSNSANGSGQNVGPAAISGNSNPANNGLNGANTGVPTLAKLQAAGNPATNQSANTSAQKLPQTGNSEEKQALAAGIIGLTMTGGLLALATKKKYEN